MPESLPDYAHEAQDLFDAQFHRVFEAAECKTQVELAAVLGIKQALVSDAKRRRVVPTEWLVKLFKLKRINPEWIRTGNGAKKMHIAAYAHNKTAVLISFRE